MNINVCKATELLCLPKKTGQLTEDFLIIATESWSLEQSNYTFASVSLKQKCATPDSPEIALLENTAARKVIMYLESIVLCHLYVYCLPASHTYGQEVMQLAGLCSLRYLELLNILSLATWGK